jgi:subtilisin-like proprotein convertase family protein
MTQLAGRAALHSEPHKSHIHRVIVNDGKQMEPLLNLYGRIRKGIEVPADLGSVLQRRLMAVGLIEIDHDGNLRVRNRLYEAVFTARWANENLPTRLRVPAMAVGLVVLLALVPFWYTQWLPRPYMDILISTSVELDTAVSAYENLRSFPGHADTANRLFRAFVEQRALAAVTVDEIDAVAELSMELPDHVGLPDAMRAAYWDRQSLAALREERRDDALLATLEALVVPTSRRRQRAAGLVADDYPLLLASIPSQQGRTTVFDPASMLLTSAEGAQISQWSYAAQELQQRESWVVTALEVVPLVRRVIVDREGVVSRIGLSLNISHARLSDLRIKIIAPSGRAVEIETGMERSSSNDDIQIPAAQLRELLGESLAGTWSISLRDEALGIAGRLVGWNLKLNSQGAVEDFQRGLNIPDPVERETENVWFDQSGRYAVARAMQSDSARIWDLTFAEPVRAIAVSENETLIGLDAGARHLVTATQGTINLWSTASGDRVLSLGVGATSSGASLTGDGAHLFVEHRGDSETRLELWSLDDGTVAAELVVAGVPSLVAIMIEQYASGTSSVANSSRKST